MQETETQQQKHTRIARQFLEAADRFSMMATTSRRRRNSGGRPVTALKALCIRRRWRHGKYPQIREAARRLTQETRDGLFEAGFGFAYAQHLNFYTDAMEAHDIDFYRPTIRRMVERVLAVAEG